MSSFPYSQLDKLIKEYDEDTRIIRKDKLIIQNYPKVFLMSTVSYFERQIKMRVDKFINSPAVSIPVRCHNLHILITAKDKRPITDRVYHKFCAYTNDKGSLVLDALKFYELFGGATFESDVNNKFNDVLEERKKEYDGYIGNLSNCLGINDDIDNQYARYIDVRERLDYCTFDKAEKAFLNLKYRRNGVAHDYLERLSDTFEDLRNFYYDAVLYIIALEETLKSMTM
ncbi:MAG: hypothetical protein IJX77_08505 [Ruminococcus sp.]|nr:hypothetical protein [Ruminococcus sp.]